jgi:MFS family permease
MNHFKVITKSVWMISLISFFTDISSEMLYPIMPIYLKSIGFTVFWIGVLEGISEAVSGLSKGTFGILSDRIGKRLPFVQLGYLLSSISKPLLGSFTHPIMVLLSRSTDRLGKGIRTGARDALLSDKTNEQNKGKVFGFHRAMDTLGACFGPLLALIYLYYYPSDYQTLFFIAFLPGLVSVILTLFLKDKHISNHPELIKVSQWEFFRNSSPEYKKLVIGLLGFTLLNSSDFFLLLKLKENGMTDTNLILIYILYNFVYAVFSFPMGYFADKFSMKSIYLFGLTLFSLVYLGMGLWKDSLASVVLFILYGIFSASTEGISKAWITNIHPEKASSAVGVYAGWNSIFTMISSSLAGLVWTIFGSQLMFISTGICVIFVGFYFGFQSFEKKEVRFQESKPMLPRN